MTRRHVGLYPGTFDPLTLADQISEILGWEREAAPKTGTSGSISLAGD